MQTQTLTTCYQSAQAYIIKGKLENAGIQCFITNEHFTDMMPVFQGMLGSGIKIKVLQEDYEAAKQILEAED